MDSNSLIGSCNIRNSLEDDYALAFRALGWGRASYGDKERKRTSLDLGFKPPPFQRQRHLDEKKKKKVFKMSKDFFWSKLAMEDDQSKKKSNWILNKSSSKDFQKRLETKLEKNTVGKKTGWNFISLLLLSFFLFFCNKIDKIELIFDFETKMSKTWRIT